jgi:hypothetical protein
MADFVLSMITVTERTSMSSRVNIEGYSPPTKKLKKAAKAFIAKFGLQGMRITTTAEKPAHPNPNGSHRLSLSWTIQEDYTER